MRGVWISPAAGLKKTVFEAPVRRFADIFCRLSYGAPIAPEERAAAHGEMKSRLQLIRQLRLNRARG